MRNDKKNETNYHLINEVMEKPREIINSMASKNTDPNGSYTGVPKNKNEKPVQDADDM